jgi:hypothetical protein
VVKDDPEEGVARARIRGQPEDHGESARPREGCALIAISVSPISRRS